MSAFLQVRDLSIAMAERTALKWVVDGVSFTVEKGQTLSLLGESGSGKSLIASSIIQLLPRQARICENSSILLDQQSLLDLPEKSMQQLRGQTISLIFQDALSALNPVQTIGKQIEEALRLQGKQAACTYKERINTLLEEAELPSACSAYYPHQLSGGMQQRALIAIALAGDPELLLCDEPTTALDVTLQAQLLKHLKKLQRKRKLSILFITHHIKLAHSMADDAIILQNGKVVEKGLDCLKKPKHPYTQALLNAVENKTYQAVKKTRKSNQLAIEDLWVFVKNKTFGKPTPIVKGIDLTLKPGETLGIVGESGSGKTTLARALIGLMSANTEHFTWLGEKRTHLGPHEAQIIFQNPTTALNPKWTLEELLLEGIQANPEKYNKAEAQKQLIALLDTIEIPLSRRFDYPSQISGGQCQRIAIARALATGAKLLLCDEPTSALDVAMQERLIAWLLNKQQTLGLSIILITHDFALVRRTSHNVAVMQDGCIVEYGPTQAVLEKPQHRYTQTLLSSSWL